MRYFIGDVRDEPRLRRALEGVDVVVHAAALKQVPAAEYNPFEAVKTNILGAQNVIDAAIATGVKRVDRALHRQGGHPDQPLRRDQARSDKLFVAANNHRGKHDIRFSVVRYGNVMGSRGSVIPFFKDRATSGVLPITDERMTRFWITLSRASTSCSPPSSRMRGGEIFVPKIPSYRILDVAKAIAPDATIEIVGIRPGEKLHEEMITVDDAPDDRSSSTTTT